MNWYTTSTFGTTKQNNMDFLKSIKQIYLQSLALAITIIVSLPAILFGSLLAGFVVKLIAKVFMYSFN